MRAIFITGTDTDVGKTVVTAGLLRMLRQSGIDAISIKPVQTGAETRAGRLLAPDLAFHHTAARIEVSDAELDVMAPYLYEPACSPHLAARMAYRPIAIAHILDCAESLAARHEVLLIEGAGGVLVPLNERETMRDLMTALGVPVLLVARRGLGTINHTLLSIEAIRAAGLELLGVVMNETENAPDDFIRRDNPAAIAAFGKVPILGTIPHLMNWDSAGWDRFAAGLAGFNAIRERLSA